MKVNLFFELSLLTILDDPIVQLTSNEEHVLEGKHCYAMFS